MSNNYDGGCSSRPLVMYIHISTTDTQQDRRQKVFENKSAADGFPQFELRTETVNGGAVFDQMMSLIWNRITQEDFRRLQMIIINGYGQANTGCLGDSEFTGAYLKLILLSLVHRFSPETINNKNHRGHQIVVVCAQCYSHVFAQHAKCVPASDPVFHFVPLTTAYQPYLINPELPEKMPFVKWDTRSFLKSLLLSPRRSLSSEDYVLGPTSPRTRTPRPATRSGSDITQSPTSSPW